MRMAMLGDIKATEVDPAEGEGGELQDLATPCCSASPGRCS